MQSGGRLGVLDPADPSVPDTDQWPTIRLTDGDPSRIVGLAARADGTVLADVVDYATTGCRLRLVVLDRASGIEREPVATFDNCGIDADISGTHWVTVSMENEVLVDGRTISLEPPPSRLDPATDIEVVPIAAGW